MKSRVSTLSRKPEREGAAAVYVAPNELMERWQCSRSQVDRIARREGMTRMILGTGHNGMVRYVRSEIEAFESRVRVEASVSPS